MFCPHLGHFYFHQWGYRVYVGAATLLHENANFTWEVITPTWEIVTPTQEIAILTPEFIALTKEFINSIFTESFIN